MRIGVERPAVVWAISCVLAAELKVKEHPEGFNPSGVHVKKGVKKCSTAVP